MLSVREVMRKLESVFSDLPRKGMVLARYRYGRAD